MILVDHIYTIILDKIQYMLNTCSYQIRSIKKKTLKILRVIKFLNNEVLCEIFLAKHGIFIALNLCDDVLLMIL